MESSIPKDAKKERVTLVLAPEAVSRLEHLRAVTESATPGETIRKALKFFEFVVQLEKDGQELCLRDAVNGKLTSLKFIT